MEDGECDYFGRGQEEAKVMPLGKRTPKQREGRNAHGRSKKKGKAKEGGDVKIKKKIAPQRHFKVSDFLIGVGQSSYNLQDDVTGRKADVTFGQLMEMIPRMKRQWKSFMNPIENKPKQGLVRLILLHKLPYIFPTVDAWHKGKNLREANINWGSPSVCNYACLCRKIWFGYCK